jgi:hypothetical protein
MDLAFEPAQDKWNVAQPAFFVNLTQNLCQNIRLRVKGNNPLKLHIIFFYLNLEYTRGR